MLKLSTRQDVINFETLTLPEMCKSTYEVLLKSADKYHNRTAIRFLLQGEKYTNSVDYTYKEFLNKVNATANMFRDLGIKKNEVVSFLLPNLPETMFTLYGAQVAGIINPINPLLDPEHIIDIMNAAGSKILVTLAPFPKTDLWDKAKQIINKVPSLEFVLTIDMGTYLSFIPRTLVKLTNKKPKLSGTVRQLDFNKRLAQYPSDQLTFDLDIEPSDTASYFHTGGTTGRPKIAQHTHDNEVFNAWSMNNTMGLEQPRVFFCGLPWFHVNGVIVTGLLPLTGGHTIILGSPAGYRGPGVIPNFWKIVEYYQVNFFSSVPTILQMLLDVPRREEKIDSLEYAFCGAAPLSVKLFNDFQSATGIQILEGYGFTEGTCANSANPIHGQQKIGSIGLATAHHHMKIAILDENKQYVRDASQDEIGNIVARGRNVFPGYKEDVHNENAFIHDGSHRWYNTGDLGRQDADGYFWITGRKKELIIRGGHNIDPKSIEEPLAQHPAVAAVAAVARPDKRVGELPVAYIQLKINQSVTVEELMEYAMANIKERAAVPKVIRILDELPLTAIGKVFKPALAHEQIQAVYEQELNALDAIDSCAIRVEQDSKKGVVAILNIEAKEGSNIKDIVDEALGGYTVNYECRLISL